MSHVLSVRVSVYQLSIKPYENPAIKLVWTNSKEENTPISVWLVDDNGIIEALGEYKSVKGDQKNHYLPCCYLWKLRKFPIVELQGMSQEKKNPNLKFKPESILTHKN